MSDTGVQHAAAVLDAGRPADALRLIGRHLAQFPDDAPANCVASEALRLLGRGQEALAAATKAVRTSPEDRRCWTSLAFAQREVGDHPSAVASATRAVQLAPADWGAHADLAHIAGEKDPWNPLAVQSAQEAVRLAPNQSEAHHAMAVVMLRRNQTKQAMESFRTALRLDPQSERARHDMAVTSMHSGNPAGAAVELAGLTALSPNNRRTYENFRIAIGKTVEKIHWAVFAGADFPLVILHLFGHAMSKTGFDRFLLSGLDLVMFGVIAFLIVSARRTLGASLTPIFRFVVSRDRLIAAWTVVDALALIPLAAAPFVPSSAWFLTYAISFCLSAAGLVLWFIRGRRMFVEAKVR